MGDFRDEVFPDYGDQEISMVNSRVLLLPGMLCTNFLWSRIKDSPLLRESGILCTAREPMGFAGQFPAGPYSYSIESYAERLKEWLRAEPPFNVVVGHSFFGNVIARAAPELPEHVRAIMISPALVREAQPSYCFRQLEIAKKPVTGNLFALYARHFPGIIERELVASIPKDRPSDYLPQLVREARRTHSAVLRALFISFFESVLRGGLLERTLDSNCHIVMVEGFKDVATHPHGAIDRFLTNGKAKHKKLEDAGHFPMLDSPEEIVRLVSSK